MCTLTHDTLYVPSTLTVHSVHTHHCRDLRRDGGGGGEGAEGGEDMECGSEQQGLKKKFLFNANSQILNIQASYRRQLTKNILPFYFYTLSYKL